MRLITVPVLTAADGSFSWSTVGAAVAGRLLEVIVSDSDLDTGTDGVVRDAVTGVALLTLTNVAASKAYRPRAIGQGVTGADLSGWYVEQATSGSLLVTLTDGGNAKRATLYLFLD